MSIIQPNGRILPRRLAPAPGFGERWYMADDARTGLDDHRVLSHEEWLAARTALLLKEKEFTRLRDELSRLRRALPWEAMTKPYSFEGPDGREKLADLFQDRSQLI